MAICAGCQIHHSELGAYDAFCPIQDDGTYWDGQFVCDECYMLLVANGRDIGTPLELQEAARILVNSGNG